VKVLLDNGAKVDARETWGDTTALMWAVAEALTLSCECSSRPRGADVNARARSLCLLCNRSGFAGATTPVACKTNPIP
jgi:hypothetical protein